MQRLFQYIATTFLTGTRNRPSLPFKLVCYVFSAGGFNLPATELNIRSEEKFGIADSIRRECWMVTQPVPSGFIEQAASVCLNDFNVSKRAGAAWSRIAQLV
ncbi:hypothetical protein ACEPAF_1552 [Sanghuangporus sanghuang]